MITAADVIVVGAGPAGLTAARALAAELGVGTFPTYDEGAKVLHFRGKRGTYRGAVPRISPLTLVDAGRAQARLESLARRVPVDAPWRRREHGTGSAGALGWHRDRDAVVGLHGRRRAVG